MRMMRMQALRMLKLIDAGHGWRNTSRLQCIILEVE